MRQPFSYVLDQNPPLIQIKKWYGNSTNLIEYWEIISSYFRKSTRFIELNMIDCRDENQQNQHSTIMYIDLVNGFNIW